MFVIQYPGLVLDCCSRSLKKQQANGERPSEMCCRMVHDLNDARTIVFCVYKGLSPNEIPLFFAKVGYFEKVTCMGLGLRLGPRLLIP